MDGPLIVILTGRVPTVDGCGMSGPFPGRNLSWGDTPAEKTHARTTGTALCLGFGNDFWKADRALRPREAARASIWACVRCACVCVSVAGSWG